MSNTNKKENNYKMNKNINVREKGEDAIRFELYGGSEEKEQKYIKNRMAKLALAMAKGE